MEQNSFHKTGNKFFYKELKNYTKLGLSYSAYWDKADNDFIQFQVGKTDQGIRHCKSVENYIWILLENYLSVFSKESLYLLSLSCAVHDIAKIGTDIFDHASKAAVIIHDTLCQSGYVKSQGTADAIAHIVSAHDTGNFLNVPDEYIVGEDTIVYLQSLAAIFRLADMMDNCEGRAAKFYKAYSLPLGIRDKFLNDVRNSIIASLPSKSDKRIIEVQSCASDAETIGNVEVYVKSLNEDIRGEHEKLLQNLRTKYIKSYRFVEKSFSLPYKFALKPVPFLPFLVHKRSEITSVAIPGPTVTRPILCYFLNTKTNVNHEKDLIDNLRVKGEIDPKYLYWSLSGTKNYLDLCRNPNYTLPYLAESLLREKFKDEVYPLIQHQSIGIDLVDLGVGYGEEPNIIINALLQGLPASGKIGCTLVDFSYHMLQMSVYYLDDGNLGNPMYQNNIIMAAINGDFRDLPKFKSIIPDFQNPRLFAFLGGTLGNFFEREILDIIKRMMAKEDFLILGADLISDSDKNLLASYSSKYNQKFLFGPLSGLGYRIDDCTFKCTIEEDVSNVENSRTVCSYFYLPGNRKVRVAFSIKYTLDDLRTYLVNKSKLNILNTILTDDKSYSILLLSRKMG